MNLIISRVFRGDHYYELFDQANNSAWSPDIRLQQLKKLLVECDSFNIDIFSDMLHAAKYILSFSLARYDVGTLEPPLIHSSDNHYLISNNNEIGQLTISCTCTVEHLKILLKIFPKIKYLQFHISYDDYQSIAAFLLSEYRKTNAHLFLLSVILIVDGNHLLSDYDICYSKGNIHLWC